MGEIVELPGCPKLPDKNDHEFVVDLARYAEGITDEKAIRKKYRMFDDAVWGALGDDDELVRTIENEKTRRIRDGSSKRERAQALVVKAPEVMSKILLDDSQNARHRIDSAKALNDFAANPQDSTPAAASDRFQITINLGGDVLTFDKSISIDPNDGNGSPAPMHAAIASNKSWDDNLQDNKSIGTHDIDTAAQLDLFAAPVKQGAERPDVYETIKAMSAAERSALKSFLEIENG